MGGHGGILGLELATLTDFWGQLASPPFPSSPHLPALTPAHPSPSWP